MTLHFLYIRADGPFSLFSFSSSFYSSFDSLVVVVIVNILLNFKVAHISLYFVNVSLVFISGDFPRSKCRYSLLLGATV